MGAWGVGAFENDDGADWSSEFKTADLAAGLRLITDALSTAAKTGATAYLDAIDGSRAVAAAELVASINGHPIDESPYSEKARQWVARVQPSSDPSLTRLALQAVSRVTSDPSELEELWSSSTSLSSWRSAIGELRDKLDA